MLRSDHRGLRNRDLKLMWWWWVVVGGGGGGCREGKPWKLSACQKCSQSIIVVKTAIKTAKCKKYHGMSWTGGKCSVCATPNLASNSSSCSNHVGRQRERPVWVFSYCSYFNNYILKYKYYLIYSYNIFIYIRLGTKLDLYFWISYIEKKKYCNFFHILLFTVETVRLLLIAGWYLPCKVCIVWKQNKPRPPFTSLRNLANFRRLISVCFDLQEGLAEDFWKPQWEVKTLLRRKKLYPAIRIS